METLLTEDGSFTLRSEKFGETYHSIFGARSESEHVFLSAGYSRVKKNPVSVLEMGFGSGMNAWLTCMEAQRNQRLTFYTALELYPLTEEQWTALNEGRTGEDSRCFLEIHKAPWETFIPLNPFFRLRKIRVDFSSWGMDQSFDVVYFDAFSPEIQPELWVESLFSAIKDHMNEGGVLTTYCAKGAVRRILQSLGFTVERIPGPRGKREMIRASV